VKALLLAAGLGTRLRPLTDGLPKCMLPVAGRPLLAGILELLRRHGVDDVFINLHWYPRAVREYAGDGASFGLNIQYLEEDRLSGTAGPLRKLAPELGDERFLVLNGDNLTDLDLSRLVEFHDRNRADLTVALHEEEPAKLPAKSVVETAEDGRLLRFVEKPAPGDLFSTWSSAGVYVVEPGVIAQVPPGAPFDFGHDLIPALLAANRRVYGFKAHFYLLDIGTPDAYARAEQDIMAGKVS